MLELVTLGGLAVRGENSPPDTSRIRKPLALLTVVAAAGRTGVSRDRLQALFWPESDTERARGGLKQAQYMLRQALGVDPFSARESNVALDPNVIVADFTAFQDHLRAREFGHAVALYGGSFLDGVYLKDVPEFEHWVDGERARLAALYANALEGLASDAAKHHDVTAAVDWWRRRAELDRLDGRVALLYIEALATAGDREAALRHGRVHAELVRAELGAEPDPEILKFAERLRATPAESPKTATGDALPDGPRQTVPPRPIATSPATSWRALAGRRPALLLGVSLAIVTAFVGFGAWQRKSGPARQGGKVTPVISSPGEPTPTGPSPPTAPADFAEPEPRRIIGRVLVTPLSNETHDTSAATFGRLAADWMASGLAQTGLVDVVDAQTTASLLRLRIVPNDTRGPPAPELHSLAADADAKILVVGRYYRTRDSLFVQVMIEDAAHGQLLRTLPTVSVRAGDYSRALSQLRQKVAGAFATLVDPRVESLVDRSAPAPSLAAYQAYSDGLDCFIRGQWGLTPGGCRPAFNFQTAIRADSTWTLPYIWLMYEYWTNGNSAGLDSLLGILDRRHEHLTDLDRYSVEYFKRQRVGDLEGVLAAARRATALAPRSNWTYRAAQAAAQLNRYRESVTFLRRLDPEHGWARGWSPYLQLLLQDDHMLGDHRAELRAIATAEKTDRTSHSYPALRLNALAGLGDSVSILHIVDSIIATPPVPQPGRVLVSAGAILQAATREAAAHGHAQLARQLADRCLAFVDRPAISPAEERSYPRIRAACFYSEGRWANAKAVLERSLVEPRAPPSKLEIFQTEADLVNVDTQLGDSASAALHMANALAHSFPGNQVADSMMILAHIAAIRGMKARAVELLREMPMRGGWTTILHRHPDFQALSSYPPFRALLAPQGS